MTKDDPEMIAFRLEMKIREKEQRAGGYAVTTGFYTSDVMSIIKDRQRLIEENKKLCDRLQIDSGGSDKIDELQQALDMTRFEVKRLNMLIAAAFDAGSAYVIGSHECFKQTHPDRDEWIRKNVENRQEKE